MVDDLFVPIGYIEKITLAEGFLQTVEGTQSVRGIVTALINQAVELCAGKADGRNRIYSQNGFRFALDLSINRRLREAALSPELCKMTDVTSIKGYPVDASCELVRPVIQAVTLHVILRPDAVDLIKRYHHQAILLAEYRVLGVSAISDLQAFTLAIKGMTNGNQDPFILRLN